MGVLLLLGFTVARLVALFASRHVDMPVRLGWVSAVTYGLLSSFVLVGLLVPRLTFNAEKFDPVIWAYVIPSFMAGFVATMIIDRPRSRYFWVGVGWYLVVIASLVFISIRGFWY